MQSLKKNARVMQGSGLMICAAAILYYHHLLDVEPHQMNEKSGRTQPLDEHGIYTWVTSAESRTFYSLMFAGPIILATGTFLERTTKNEGDKNG